MEGLWTRFALRVWTVLILLFLFIPIVLILVYAFNSSTIEDWPLPGLTTKWIALTWNDPEIQAALLLSLQAGLAATGLALVLGSCAAFAIHRMTFFGRDVVSLLFILPLALPGIVTGMALNSFFHFNGIKLSILTIIVGHTTFCIVVVYNNVLARLRRTQGSLIEAAMDLGANGFQTFRDITLPLIAPSLLAGSVLCWARALGEFGATITFAGNFPGVTQTMPLAVYLLLETNHEASYILSLVLLVISLGVLVALRHRWLGSA